MSPRTGMYVGIGISVGIIVIAGGIFAAVKMRGSSIGDPVATQSPEMLKKIEMNLDFSRLFTMPPSSNTGADQSYKAAVKLAVEYGDLFTIQVDRAVHPEQDEKFKPILDKLEEGADKGLGDTTLTFDMLPAVNAKTEWDIRGMLNGVAIVASRTAMSRAKAGDKEGALKASRAGLLWGFRLYRNSDNYVAYKSGGIFSISEAFGAAELVYKTVEPSKLSIEKELYTEYRKVGDLFYKKQCIMLIPDGDFKKMECADLWNIAEHDEDRAWRVEGIMWLGVGKWTSALPNQRASIQSYLEQKAATSNDALIAKYAKEAAKATREDAREVALHLPR